MGLLSNNSREAKEYDTYPIQTRYDVPVESVPGQLLDIHPYRDNDGIEAGANLLQALHDVRIRDVDIPPR